MYQQKFDVILKGGQSQKAIPFNAVPDTERTDTEAKAIDNTLVQSSPNTVEPQKKLRKRRVSMLTAKIDYTPPIQSDPKSVDLQIKQRMRQVSAMSVKNEANQCMKSNGTLADTPDPVLNKLQGWMKQNIETEMQTMSLKKFIIEKLNEDINQRKRDAVSKLTGKQFDNNDEQKKDQNQNSIKLLLNQLDPKDIAEIFINNDDGDNNNLTYSDIQEGIMMNLERDQLNKLHSYFKEHENYDQIFMILSYLLNQTKTDIKSREDDELQQDFEKMIIENIKEFNSERVEHLVNLIQMDKILINNIITKLSQQSTNYPQQLIIYAIRNYEPRYSNFLQSMFLDSQVIKQDLQEMNMEKEHILGQIKSNSGFAHLTTNSSELEWNQVSDKIYHKGEKIEQSLFRKIWNCNCQDEYSIQNRILIKTMRFKIFETLGSQENIDLLEAIEIAPNDMFNSPIIQYIDYMWLNYNSYIITYNSVYVVYPILVLAALAFTTNNLHDNAQLALILTGFPLIIELFQIATDFKDYFSTGANLFDFFGLISIIVFFSAGHNLEYRVNLPILLFGLFCIFYRAIMSLSVIYEKFMINMRLIKNSIYGMIPFLAVLGTQVLLFASLNSVKELNDMYEGKIPKVTGEKILASNLFDTVMIIFGTKEEIQDDDYVKWALYIAYAFLIVIVNMKLVISVIGETYGKQQISRVAMAYQMKAAYLIELAKMRKLLDIFVKSSSNQSDMKYFHWFYYEDSHGQVDNQWPGMLKIIVKHVQQTKSASANQHSEMLTRVQAIEQEMDQKMDDKLAALEQRIDKKFDELKDLIKLSVEQPLTKY